MRFKQKVTDRGRRQSKKGMLDRRTTIEKLRGNPRARIIPRKCKPRTKVQVRYYLTVPGSFEDGFLQEEVDPNAVAALIGDGLLVERDGRLWPAEG